MSSLMRLSAPCCTSAALSFNTQPGCSIPYAIGMDTEKGKVFEGITTVFDGVKFFILFAGSNTKAHHDYFNVNHEGLYFCHQNHKKLEDVIATFKKNAMGERSNGAAVPLPHTSPSGPPNCNVEALPSKLPYSCWSSPASPQQSTP